jgi:carboxyl-terminal processing protease
MVLDDAVKLIKGPKGTNVYLTVKRVDGTVEVVTVTRDIVILEETYAKSSLIKDQSVNYGLIELPKFYINFQDYNQRNAATDVKKELEQLKKNNVKGIILDLRNNGGADHQRHPTPQQTQYHARHFCHYQMASPSQLLQARDTILYDTRNHIRHPKK